MCPAVANTSAQKTIVVSLYLICGIICFSVWPSTKKISNPNSDFSRKSPSGLFMKFNWPLSCLGRIFSERKEAFSLGFGFVAHSQWFSLLQNLAFLKAGSYPVLFAFHCTLPPQWSKCKCVIKTSVTSSRCKPYLAKDLSIEWVPQ